MIFLLAVATAFKTLLMSSHYRQAGVSPVTHTPGQVIDPGEPGYRGYLGGGGAALAYRADKQYRLALIQVLLGQAPGETV